MGNITRQIAILMGVGLLGAACTPFPDVPERRAGDELAYPSLVATDSLVALIPAGDRIDDETAAELQSRGEEARKEAAAPLPAAASDLAARGAELRDSAGTILAAAVPADLSRRGAELEERALASAPPPATHDLMSRGLALRERATPGDGAIDTDTLRRLQEGREMLEATARELAAEAAGEEVRVGDARRLLDLVETEKLAGLAETPEAEAALQARLSRLRAVAADGTAGDGADAARRRAERALAAVGGEGDPSTLTDEERRRLLLERLRLSREGSETPGN